MRYRPVETDALGRVQANALGNLKRACLVLTAGTTSVGAVDPLDTIGQAAWTHVDAAWAGPLRLSERHAEVLAGIERADSVAISAHKWLFQPKESALILFRDTPSTARNGFATLPPIRTLTRWPSRSRCEQRSRGWRANANPRELQNRSK
jgi:glutamate/tyrosine decarboxylase-like PLP-dependent enzyme